MVLRTHVCVCEELTEFSCNCGDSNRRRLMVDGATLAQPYVNGGVNCPLVKDIAGFRRVALWMRALCETEDWACALMKRVLGDTGANATAFIHRRILCTNHAQQIIGAFKGLRWAYPDDAMPQGLKSISLFSQQQATSILVTTCLRHNQRHHNTWARCSTTHLMMKCSEKSARMIALGVTPSFCLMRQLISFGFVL